MPDLHHIDAVPGSRRDLDEFAAGIAAGIPEVQAQIDRLNSVLSKLNNTGKFEFSFGTGLRFGGSGGLIAKPEGEFETGLDRVPFNDFLAVLHEGESVLTAEEAKIWLRIW